jgi:serine kinase of HPr protein (carbohydrate metabolism regulator)
VCTDVVARGRVLVADDETDLADERPGDCGVDASTTLAAMREGER